MGRLPRWPRAILRWLMGIPPADELDAHRHLAAERDRNRDGAIEAGDRGNLTGMRPGSGPQARGHRLGRGQLRDGVDLGGRGNGPGRQRLSDHVLTEAAPADVEF